MSLIEQLQADIKERLGKSGEGLLNMVELYGGNFNASEIGKTSTASPACFITCLGWTGVEKPMRITAPARSVRLGFFVVVKSEQGRHSLRANRMLQAAWIAERLCRFLSQWQNFGQAQCMGKFEQIGAENLYSREVDASGLGLWLVTASVETSYCGHDGAPILVSPQFEFDSHAVTSITPATQAVSTTPTITSITLTLNGETP